MQKRIMMWYANINHHKHIISLSHLLTQEVKLPLSFRRDGREVKNIALCLDITALLKTLFLSLKHIFQPHKPPYDTFAPKCGKLHFSKGIIYCTFVVVECIHAYYTTTEK